MTNVINSTVTFASTTKGGGVATTSSVMLTQPPIPQGSSLSPSSEYVAVILAGSIGTRLYPITNDDDKDNHCIPKHMLPICGIPILLRLLKSIELCGFVECLLLLKNDDTTTMDMFLNPNLSYQHPYQVVPPQGPTLSKNSSTTKDGKTTEFSSSATGAVSSVKVTTLQSTQMKVTILQYDTPCLGTVDALRRIVDTNTTLDDSKIICNTSHMVVFPSDLLVFDTTPIRNMIHEHRCHGRNHRYHHYNNNSNTTVVNARETTPSPNPDINHDFTTGNSANPISSLPTPPQQGQSSLTLPKSSTNSTTTTTTGTTIITGSNGSSRYSPNRLVPSTVAGKVLLMDVTAIDESTLQPIYKESAKQKKGLLSRDEDDVFYIAIQSATSTNTNFSSNVHHTTSNRLIWKQSKFDVEEDKEQIGTTPKVKLSKYRLYGGGGGGGGGGSTATKNTLRRPTDTMSTRLSTEWNDVHCYCISSWVLQQLSMSKKLQSVRYQSIQYDLLPLLISRQYRGIEATFHSSSSNNAIASKKPNANTSASSSTALLNPVDADQKKFPTLPTSSQTNHDDDQYMILAHVSNSRTIASSTPSIFRCHTITSYLFANRVMAHELSAMNVTSLHHQQQQQQQSSSASPSTTTNTINLLLLSIPTGTTIQSKFHTILLPECNIGEKVTFKSCVIGRHCTIGNNCRLNNVVLHDHVTIGDNTTLQSTIVSAHATIGSNCNFNDCQILHHMNIPSNTKKKGEAITSVDE